ncbi:MAG: ATP-binding protein, partial [Pirellulaceae bacterium]|nr:ATP-binding protein [Pirellulaceae bacterium]
MQTVAATDLNDDFLDSTDHIAYQYSNLIQSHILFLNVDRQEKVILNVSTNVDKWLGVNAAEVTGRVLNDDLFPGITNVLEKLEYSLIAHADLEHQTPQAAQVLLQSVKDRHDNPIVCRVVATPTRWMIELESEYHECDVNVDNEQLERQLLESIQALSRDISVEELVTVASKNLRELLGYERGMCYRFDDEYNGEVIAESIASSEVVRYLGLRFPARDIPRTAREMLVASPIRTTLDQQLACSEISPPRDPVSQTYIDLTHIRGRGAAGSCREFYLNMNIRSTLVLPLVVEGRLWGLLSLHDSRVRRVRPQVDAHLQSIAKCISVSIERSLRDVREEAGKQGLQVVMALSEVDATSNQWLRYIQSRSKDLKELLPCDGFILRLAGEILTAGVVPEGADRKKFTEAIWKLTQEKSQGKSLVTNCLALYSKELESYRQVAAGVIAIPLTSDFEDIAIWIRPEQKQTLNWAGDPLSDIEVSPRGRIRLSPRASFKLWTQVTDNKCLPWTAQELSLAASASIQLGLLALSWHAAQASQAKTQFLSCMSHEIRTPMTAILGYVGLLKEQCESPSPTNQVTDYIDVIERNSHHLLSVIDDILNLAKIEAGKLSVEQIPISISNLLADVVALTKVQADTKQLGFGVELETPIPKTIYGDPVRLRQILLNLLSNALKFTEKGKVTLNVGFESASRKIYFEVIDTGIGLTEVQIGRLFSAFSQADTSTTRRFGGSGLGLQISKNLAQLLGGDITVRSQAGVGSRFRVTVASNCTEDCEMIQQLENTKKTGKLESTTQPTQSSLKDLRIMLLEDGEDNQRLLRHLLSKAGAEVTIFDNGKLGLEAVTTNGQLDGPLQTPFPFDLVLTDIQMPELDGYTTTRLLREKGCEHPIIALTAYAMEGNNAECLRAGCSD